MKTISKILSVVLCLAMVLGLIGVVSAAETPATAWTPVDFEDITANDTIAITMTNNSDGTVWVLPTADATTGPKVATGTVTDNTLTVIGTKSDYGWTISAVTGGYTIKSSTGSYLYLTDANNGIKIGSTECIWNLATVSDGKTFLYATVDNNIRYMGVSPTSSGGADMRCYDEQEFTSDNVPVMKSTISGQTLGFWKYTGDTTVVTEDPVPATLVTELADGDKVYIYNVDGYVLSATPSGNKLAGIEAELVDGKLPTLSTMVELTVTVANGQYVFTADGKYLTSTATNKLAFADEQTEYSLWNLETTDGGFKLQNEKAAYSNQPGYLQVSNGAFATYTSPTNSKFVFQFYAACEHTNTSYTKTDSEHTMTCSDCGYNTTEDHDLSYKHSETHHWQECAECRYTTEANKAAHSLTNGVCGTCGYGCQHEESNLSTKYDETNHWTECSCGAVIENTTVAHTWTKKTSDSKHWEECTCGAKKGEADHTYTDGKCSCGASDPNYTAPEKNEPVIDTGVAEPKAGTAFKWGMYQENVGKYLYFNNTIPNEERPYYLGTTDKYNEAVDVYVEEVTGGYKLYFMDGETKTYIDIYQNGTYVNARLTTEPTAVYTWNTEYKTFVAKIGDTDYYIGTYNEFDTLGASKLSYAATSFPSHLYAEEPAPTGDNSVVSLAIAAAVLSVLGTTALIMKKKEF